MKRREFNFGLLAAGVAPLVKTPVAVKAAPAAATAANFTPYMYAAGTQFARFHGSCSAELLAARLGVSTEAASAITARMVKNGIITAPNALGISQPTNKYAPTPKPDSAPAQKATEHPKPQIKLREDAGDALDLVEEDADDVTEPDDLTPTEDPPETDQI